MDNPDSTLAGCVLALILGGLRLAWILIKEKRMEAREREAVREYHIVAELNRLYDQETMRGGFDDPQRLDHLAEREGYGDR